MEERLYVGRMNNIKPKCVKVMEIGVFLFSFPF
jgi:hypothetical protein